MVLPNQSEKHEESCSHIMNNCVQIILENDAYYYGKCEQKESNTREQHNAMIHS